MSRGSLSENCSAFGMAPNSSMTVFPRRRHWSMSALRPATANCQGNRGWGGEETECYDRDAGLPAVLAYASEKALRPTSARPHHGNEDGTGGLRRVMGSSHRAAS